MEYCLNNCKNFLTTFMGYTLNFIKILTKARKKKNCICVHTIDSQLLNNIILEYNVSVCKRTSLKTISTNYNSILVVFGLCS